MVNVIPCLDILEKTQCFPFYVYDEDGSNQRENITDWALGQFRTHYGDESIDKWAIFYYVYGVLHHPVYRERYADNLKRELPRIPYVGDKSAFHAISEAGKALANLHLTYEDAKPHRLNWVEKAGTPVSFKVEKMKFKNALTNDALTLNPSPSGEGLLILPLTISPLLWERGRG